MTGKRARAPEGSGLVAEKIGHDLSCRIGPATLALWARIDDEEEVRLSDQRKTLDLIARRPDLAVMYPDSKSRRRFARKCNAQRKALGLQAIADHSLALSVVTLPAEISAAVDDFGDFDDCKLEHLMQQLAADRAQRHT